MYGIQLGPVDVPKRKIEKIFHMNTKFFAQELSPVVTLHLWEIQLNCPAWVIPFKIAK